MTNDAEELSQQQVEHEIPANSPHDAGDRISVGVESSNNVAAGKNIIQIGSLSVPRWGVLCLLAGVIVLTLLVSATTYFTKQTGESAQQAAVILARTPTPEPTPSPTPLPFAPAKEGETMILIIPFHSTTAVDTEPHNKIRNLIREYLKNSKVSSITVYVERNLVLAADQKDDAESAAKRYNASMVIWGEDTGVAVDANYLNMRNPRFAAADVHISEMNRTQIADPKGYAEFITRDLPGSLSVFAFFAIGHAQLENRNHRTAIDFLNKAVAAANSLSNQFTDDSAESAPVLEGLYNIYLDLGWLHQLSASDPSANLAAELTAAIDNYTKAIALVSPDDQLQLARVYNNRGSAYYDQKQFITATLDFDKAIEGDPEWSLVYYNLGLARLSLGDYARATKNFDKAITLNKPFPQAFNNRGRARQALGKLDDAISDYTQAITLLPENAMAYTNRGTAYTEKGDYVAAVDNFNYALTLDPRSFLALYNRSNAYYFMGNLDAAIGDATAAAELNPQNDKVNNNLCWFLGLQQQANRAQDYCERAIELNPDPNYYESRGLTLAQLGEYSAAIADLETYIGWLKKKRPNATSEIAQHEEWVESLQHGKNPFTAAVLQQLNGK